MRTRICYNNRFFATKEEALAFRKQHGGRLISLSPKSRKETRMDFQAEMAVAWDARGEVIDKEATPYCVAWNEVVKR